MSENKEYVTQLEGQGNVHISEDAICTVAAMAAIEIEGVAGLSGLGSDISAKKNLSKGVRLRTTEDELTIDLSLLVKFGSNIQAVARAVQEAVVNSVESVVGLTVAAVNVHVAGVAFEQ